MCEQTLRALESREFDSYGSKRVDPPVLRYGIGVSDHRRNGKVAGSYWDALEAHRQAWPALGLPFDPYKECRDALGTDWPRGVVVGHHDGREMGPGVAREPNQGFQVHFDDALREFSGDLLDAPLVAQFAFNLYLSVPKSGGEMVLWRHLWCPTDEAFRLPHSYGYDKAVVGDAESIELKPEVGEAILINPRYYHAVRPSRGSRRIALGFAVAMSDIGELLTWG
ncbi:proline hydroxylase [Streptomyces sp. NBC_01381]|uniref:2OG-Fe(II)-dependent halogenase WelO5 family protein n=1 Tax=Streptomyces sp. NBC_01381 TaxID=2903845 RepID=UPI00224E699A|nr:proline hydroxylase [Streptomyces sp. NBC_01381]MCX4672342.1 proline hydroxylase [Streptomyces sp. NBC_01381]